MWVTVDPEVTLSLKNPGLLVLVFSFVVWWDEGDLSLFRHGSKKYSTAWNYVAD